MDGDGPRYQVQCNRTFSGNVIPDGSSAAGGRKRSIQPSIQACLATCDSTTDCVAAVLTGETCTLFSSIDGTASFPGAEAAIRSTYAETISAILSVMMSSSAVPSFSSQLSDYISNQISEAAPVSTSPDTVVYSTPAASSSSSTLSDEPNAFSSQLSQYLSSQLSENSPLSTSADTVVFITSSSTLNQASSSSSSTSASTSSTSTSAISSSTSSTQPSIGTSSSLSTSGGSSTSTSSTITSSVSTSTSSTVSTQTSSSTTSTTSTTSSRSSSTSISSSSQSTSTFTSTIRTSTSSSTSSPTTPTPLRNNGKRGLAYNQANLTLPFSLSGQNSRVSWAYNWFYQACPTGQPSCPFNPALQHIPLLFSNASDLLSAWPAAARAAISSGVPALMSFNEPDICAVGSACMSVSDSVTTYQQYMQPFSGQAALGAPAVTNGGPPIGLTWLTEFLGNCTGCTIDFINIHWYSNKFAGATYLKSFVNEARAVAKGKPIWITEFGLSNENPYTAAELQAFLQDVLPWLDQQPDVQRYAYFMAAPGILLDQGGRGMSGAGVVYNNFTNATVQPN